MAQTKYKNQYNNTYKWHTKTYTSHREIWTKFKHTLQKHGVRQRDLRGLLDAGVHNTQTLIKYKQTLSTNKQNAKIAKQSSFRKPVIWDGVVYADRYEAAAKLGVSLPTVMYRISKNYTNTSDMKRTPSYGITVEYDGKTYPTKSQAVVSNRHLPATKVLRECKVIGANTFNNK